MWIYAVYLIIENEKIEKKHLLHIYNKPLNWELLKKFGINFYHTWFYLLFLRNCDHFYFMDGDDTLIMREEEERKKLKLYMCKNHNFLQLFYFWIKLTRLLGQRKNLSNDLYFFINLFVAYVLMTFFKKKNPFEDNEIMFTKNNKFTTTPNLYSMKKKIEFWW